MRRSVGMGLLACAAFTVVGCTSGPDAARVPQAAAIFERAQQPVDRLPDDVVPLLDPDSSRYVGEDSAGDRYWAVRDGAAVECIVHQTAGEPGQHLAFCGGPSISGTTADGVVVEFASSPSHLDPSSAELVGDTLLVERP